MKLIERNKYLRNNILISHIILAIVIISNINAFAFSPQSAKILEHDKKIIAENKKLNLYRGELFIGVDDVFSNNESLNIPVTIRYNPATKDFVIADTGNDCLYLVTEKGKFKKKIGQRGQGPGDFMNPMYVEIDSKGDIYVYDTWRISIFSQDGKYITSFRMKGINPMSEYLRLFRFSVSSNREIVTNLCSINGYYISVLSRNGEITKSIGIIDKKFEREDATLLASIGYAFKGNNSKYYIVLLKMQLMRMYDENGKLEKEVNVCDLIKRPERKKDIKSKQLSNYYNSTNINVLLYDVIFDGNIFYFLPTLRFREESLILVDNGLSFLKEYKFGVNPENHKLPFKNVIISISEYTSICINNKLNAIELYIPTFSSEIIKYSFSK